MGSEEEPKIELTREKEKNEGGKQFRREEE